MTTTSMENLEAQLNALIALSDNFREQLELEKQALVSRDISTLDGIVEIKSGIQKQISHAENELAHNLNQAGFIGADGRISLDGNKKLPTAIEQGLIRLQEQATQCKQLMADNESIVNANLAQVNQALNMLRREQSPDSTSIYTSSAETKLQTRPRPEISVA